MPILKAKPRRRAARLAATAAMLALIGGLAGGCTTTATSDVDLADYDYRKRHPIMISEEPEVLRIPVGMNGPALSPEIEAAIGNYVDGYRATGTGSITIQVPNASANEFAASSTGRAVHYALVRAGVPYANIRIAPYHVGDHAKVAPLQVSYLRVKAVAPTCGVWPEPISGDLRNRQYHNFGCAAQQNLAAMVANPADFVQPQPMTPANGARRAKVITDYSEGLETRSEMTLPESSAGGL